VLYRLLAGWSFPWKKKDSERVHSLINGFEFTFFLFFSFFFVKKVMCTDEMNLQTYFEEIVAAISKYIFACTSITCTNIQVGQRACEAN
jgi:hypothetical protein